MDPNPIKKIHQFISSFPVKERTNNITSFYSKRDLSYFFSTFFTKKNMGISISSTSTNWWEKDICAICELPQLLVESYSGFEGIPYWV